MKYRFVFYEDITEEMVFDMEERLDSECYPEYAGCAAGQLEVYRKNKRSRIALFKGDELVGYACILPITDEVYREIKAGKTYNLLLRPDQVAEYVPGGHFRLYIDGFALKPEERNFPLASRLFSAIFFEIGRMAKEGIEIDEIICDVTDRRLARFLAKKGFSKTGETASKSLIYTISKDCFPVTAETFNGTEVNMNETKIGE